MIYRAPFLVWWGLSLFLCKLESLRQLDYALRDEEREVLDNMNALAQTAQETLPVYKTLSHYLGHLGQAALADLIARMIRALVRKKVLDRYRLQGALVIAVDGTGHLSFARRHCEHCLTQKHRGRTVFLHKVLDAKLVTSNGLALSLAGEFIDNRDHAGGERVSAKKRKQDVELKAFRRLAPQIARVFPQTRLCLAGDALYACGPVITLCRKNKWHYVFTFKRGRLPALWNEFQSLLPLCPENVQRVVLPDGTHQELRWVNDLAFTDTEGTEHVVNALQCVETKGDDAKTFAWITDFRLTPGNVIAIAQQGGRNRWKIENGGFNVQKNGGYNLEHVYGSGEELLKCFYTLLQIAHLILQLVEKGSLLRRAARSYGRSVLAVYGSVHNIARRFLDCLRYRHIPPDALAPGQRTQIRLDPG